MPLPGVRWSTPKSDAGLWHEAGESHTLNGGGDGGEQRVAAGGRATAKRFPARAAEGAVVVVAYCGAAALTCHWQPLCWRNLELRLSQLRCHRSALSRLSAAAVPLGSVAVLGAASGTAASAETFPLPLPPPFGSPSHVRHLSRAFGSKIQCKTNIKHTKYSIHGRSETQMGATRG